MKGIVNKKGTLRIPNHRAPNQQLTISSKSASVSTRRCKTKSHQLENSVYHFLRQLWLFLGVNLMEINSNDCFPGIYLVIQSALFAMVKWPFEMVKWPPTIGDEKVTNWITWYITPHTTPVVAVMLLFLVNARFIRSWMPWRQPPRWNFSVDLLLKKLRHPWDKNREQTCDLKFFWCPPKKGRLVLEGFSIFCVFCWVMATFFPKHQVFYRYRYKFWELRKVILYMIPGSCREFFFALFFIAVDSANSKLLVWGLVVFDSILGVPLSNNPFP